MHVPATHLIPLLLDALDAGKISVGPPYFNSVFVPLMLPLAALLGFAPLARWKRDGWSRLVVKVRLPFLVAVLASVALAFGTPASWAMAAGTGFARRQGLSCGVPVLLQEPAPQNLWRRVADAGRVSMQLVGTDERGSFCGVDSWTS